MRIFTDGSCPSPGWTIKARANWSSESARPAHECLYDLDALLALPVPGRQDPAEPEREQPTSDEDGGIDLRQLLTSSFPAVGSQPTDPTERLHTADYPPVTRGLYTVLAVMFGMVVGLATALILALATQSGLAPPTEYSATAARAGAARCQPAAERFSSWRPDL